MVKTLAAKSKESRIPKGAKKLHFRRMTKDEKRIIREMHFDKGIPPAEIGRVLPVDLSNICGLLAQNMIPNPIGRWSVLSASQVDRAVRVLEEMVEEANAEKEVTVAMVLRRARLKCCERTLSKALHLRG